MPHDVKVIVNSPELRGTADTAVRGFDVVIEIDGRPFNASKFSLTARAGGELLKATLEFPVSNFQIVNPTQALIETEFQVIENDGSLRNISIEEYKEILNHTRGEIE